MTKQNRKRLPLEEIVIAQNMACAGASMIDIALELGCPPNQIAMLLDPEPALPATRPSATMGYQHIKDGYR